jgi:hypothetical protein
MGYMVLRKRGKNLVAMSPGEPVVATPAPIGASGPTPTPAPAPTGKPVIPTNGPPDEPSPAFMQIMETIHTGNAITIKALIRRLEDARELQKTYNMEQAHPSYPGGRQGVLDAVDERLNEMGLSHMSPSLDL